MLEEYGAVVMLVALFVFGVVPSDCQIARQRRLLMVLNMTFEEALLMTPNMTFEEVLNGAKHDI